MWVYLFSLFKIGCESAELIEKNGFLYQTGGPIENKSSYCKSPDNGGFALPYEVGFVVNFTSINSKPRGCGVLDLNYLWRPHGQEPWKNQIYPGKMTKSNNFNYGFSNEMFFQEPKAKVDQQIVDAMFMLLKEQLWPILWIYLPRIVKLGKRHSSMLGKRCKSMDMKLMI